MSEKQGSDRGLAALRREERGPRVFDPSGARKISAAHTAAKTRVLATLGGSLDAQARGAYERQLARVEAEINTAWADAQKIENDASLYPRQKREALAARIEQADTTINQAIADARGVVDVLKAEATVQALPRMPADQQAQNRARSDTLMMLDRVAPDRRADLVSTLAGRDDAIGALVTSQWGADYLSATDPGTAATVHRRAVEQGIEAGRTSGDPTRAAAADAVREVGQLTGIADTARAPWRAAVEAITNPS